VVAQFDFFGREFEGILRAAVFQGTKDLPLAASIEDPSRD